MPTLIRRPRTRDPRDADVYRYLKVVHNPFGLEWTSSAAEALAFPDRELAAAVLRLHGLKGVDYDLVDQAVELLRSPA